MRQQDDRDPCIRSVENIPDVVGIVGSRVQNDCPSITIDEIGVRTVIGHKAAVRSDYPAYTRHHSCGDPARRLRFGQEGHGSVKCLRRCGERKQTHSVKENATTSTFTRGSPNFDSAFRVDQSSIVAHVQRSAIQRESAKTVRAAMPLAHASTRPEPLSFFFPFGCRNDASHHHLASSHRRCTTTHRAIHLLGRRLTRTLPGLTDSSSSYRVSKDRWRRRIFVPAPWTHGVASI